VLFTLIYKKVKVKINSLLSYMAQKERKKTRQRQAEGIGYDNIVRI
jgi:hypothetical protein